MRAVAVFVLVGACASRPDIADVDGDGICDELDRFPDDASLPGRLEHGELYAVDVDALYAYDWRTATLTHVVDLDVDEIILDIALDESGALFVLTPNLVWSCHPETGSCAALGSLPDPAPGPFVYRSLGVFQPGDLGPGQPHHVAFASDGTWAGLTEIGDTWQVTELEPYADGLRADGDIVATEHGVYAVVRGSDSGGLLPVDLAARTVGDAGIPLPGAGLASVDGALYGFGPSGRVQRWAPGDTEVRRVAEDFDVAFTGAGSTPIPVAPDCVEGGVRVAGRASNGSRRGRGP